MAKKNFKTDKEEITVNPALSYFTDKEPEAERAEPAKENKSRRLNILIRPSLLKDITKIATMNRTSTNDLINTVLEAYAEQEAATIEKYNHTFTEE